MKTRLSLVCARCGAIDHRAEFCPVESALHLPHMSSAARSLKRARIAIRTVALELERLDCLTTGQVKSPYRAMADILTEAL